MNVTLLFLQIGEMNEGEALQRLLTSLVCKTGGRGVTLGSIARVIDGGISVGHFDEGREHRADIGGGLFVGGGDDFQKNKEMARRPATARCQLSTASPSCPRRCASIP